MPFNSTVKFSLCIVEDSKEYSNYTVLVKGAPEKLWSLSKVYV